MRRPGTFQHVIQRQTQPLLLNLLASVIRLTFAGEEHSAMIHRDVYVEPNDTSVSPSRHTFSPPLPVLYEQQPQITFSRFAPSDNFNPKNDDEDDEDDDNFVMYRRPTNRSASAMHGGGLRPPSHSNGTNMPVLVTGRATDDVTIQMKDLLERLVANQDRRIRPNFGQQPVPVGVTIHISTISSINEVEMDYTLDFYFRQYWEDPRLRFHAPFLKGKVVSVGADFLSRIWVPDTFFPNEKSSFFHSATTTNKFVRISPSGQLEVSVRLTVTAACPMNLTYFPMDRQRCALQVESYGYSTRDIYYYWKPQSPKPSAEVDPNMELPQFEVWPKGGCRNLTIHYVLSTGNYSRLVCEFLFQRTMGYYLIQIYIPASLIVIISWVSFWLSRDSTPSRVTLGVTVVLAMTTLMSGTTASLPKVSYVKSIDVYLGTCFVMVFSSLLEYAAVGYTAKRMKMRRARRRLHSHLARGLFAAGSIGLPMQATVQAINETHGRFGSSGSASHKRGGGGGSNVFALMREPDRRESFAVQVDAEGNVISMDDYYDNFDIGPYGSGHVDSSMHVGAPHRRYFEEDTRYGEKRPRRWQTLINRNTSNQLRPPTKLPKLTETEPMVPKKQHSSKTNHHSTTTPNFHQQNFASPLSPPSASNNVQYASNAFTLPLAERSSPSSSASFSPPPPLQILVSPVDENEPPKNLLTHEAEETVSHHNVVESDEMQRPEQQQEQQPPLFMYDGRHGNMRERSEFNPSDIDKYSRIVFPLAFVAFNIVYWFSYLHVANMVDKEMMYDIPNG